jgi:hypothetical protein
MRDHAGRRGAIGSCKRPSSEPGTSPVTLNGSSQSCVRDRFDYLIFIIPVVYNCFDAFRVLYSFATTEAFLRP